MVLDIYNINKTTAWKKLECDDLLVVEFVCSPENPIKQRIYTELDCFIYVTSGRKIYNSLTHKIEVNKGSGIYCKKGGLMIENHYEEEFCALLCFFSDELIKQACYEIKFADAFNFKPASISETSPIQAIYVTDSIQRIVDSLTEYLYEPQIISKDLTRMKLKELLMIFLLDEKYIGVRNNLCNRRGDYLDQMEKIMLENYTSPISIAQFAKLSSRSISTFGRDFKKIFNCAPSKWITQKRLEFAELLLRTSDDNINDITIQSGFESTSHFIRTFKKKYGYSPQRYRNQLSKN